MSPPVACLNDSENTILQNFSQIFCCILSGFTYREIYDTRKKTFTLDEKSLKKQLLHLYLVLIFSAGCENEAMMESFSLNTCGEAGEKVEQVSGRTGTMWYNEELDEYRIQYAEPGTYDAV